MIIIFISIIIINIIIIILTTPIIFLIRALLLLLFSSVSEEEQVQEEEVVGEQEVWDCLPLSLSLPLGSRGLANSFIKGGAVKLIIMIFKLCMCTKYIYIYINLSAFPIRNFTYAHNRIGFKKNSRI